MRHFARGYPGRPADGGREATGRTAGATAEATAGQPSGSPAVRLSQVQTADGSLVTVATFAGPVQYSCTTEAGSQPPDPVLLHAGPAIGTAERSRLLAAFNGGFLMRSRAGGYEQEGHVFRDLRHGLASLVIDRSGHARIGVWGPVSPPWRECYSVRQNLWPLHGGKPTRNGQMVRWGGTVGHVEYVARSALGQNAPRADLRGEHVHHPATWPTHGPQRCTGRHALDINPEWSSSTWRRAGTA